MRDYHLLKNPCAQNSNFSLFQDYFKSCLYFLGFMCLPHNLKPYCSVCYELEAMCHSVWNEELNYFDVFGRTKIVCFD